MNNLLSFHFGHSNTDPFYKKKSFLLTLCLLIFLVSLNVFLSDYLRIGLLDVEWQEGDDALHISVANSFATKRNFDIGFRGSHIFTTPIPELMKVYSDIEEPYGGKGPVFYILLGSFYDLFDTKPGDFYLHASYYSTIISSLFVVVFFFLVNKYFSTRIAFFSTLLIVFSAFFEWNAARAIPGPTLFLFMILPFLFLEKKFKHYFLFTFFASIAHITHPFGIWVPSAYLLYLLIKREFKGAIIVFFTWFGVLLPTFIHNYYNFSQIGLGLYIPFSKEISTLFSFLPTNVYRGGTNISLDYLPLERISSTKIDLFSGRKSVV